MTTYHYKSVLTTLLAVLAFMISTTMKAQHMQATLSHYTVDNGLPSNAISNIVNDDYGYVWIATWNGISRFDGFNFYNYKTGRSSGVRGLHNRVEQLVIDQAQNVWMKMEILTVNVIFFCKMTWNLGTSN